MQDETNGVNFLSRLCLFSPDGAASPDSNSLGNDYCQKKFSRLFLQDSAPHCPGKKIQVCHAVQYTFPKAISLEVQDHTSTPISVKCLFLG